MLIFDIFEKGQEIVPQPHFVYDFLRKMLLLKMYKNVFY